MARATMIMILAARRAGIGFLFVASVVPSTYFMLKNGYIKNDFDVHEWAAPEFLEQAAKELLEERRQKVTTEKLPEATSLRMG